MYMYSKYVHTYVHTVCMYACMYSMCVRTYSMQVCTHVCTYVHYVYTHTVSSVHKDVHTYEGNFSHNIKQHEYMRHRVIDRWTCTWHHSYSNLRWYCEAALFERKIQLLKKLLTIEQRKAKQITSANLLWHWGLKPADTTFTDGFWLESFFPQMKEPYSAP
jgi:hypothetical protein